MRRTSLQYTLASLLVLTGGACKKKAADTDVTKGSDGSAASAGSGDPAAAVGTKGAIAALGAGTPGEFTPTSQGFKFQNYGNQAGIENLTPAELERMFGDGVCGDREGDTCILTPPASRWMADVNKGMGGGHCEGLAAMALLFQQGKLAAKDFGADSAFDLKLEGNAKLQHEVAYWWSTQAVMPMKAAEIKTMTPDEIVDKLVEGFKTNAESYTIGIYMADWSGGHATTPYAVVDKGGDKWWILHYDNNFPGVERHIEVDRKANTWTYFTAANPAEPGATYRGDATTKTLTIAPTSVRVGKLVCPFCADIDPDAPAGGDAKGSRQIMMDGQGDLLVATDDGKRIGHVDGKLVNEIPGATATELRSESLRSEQEPVYELPAGKPLTVTLDGTKMTAKDLSDVSLIGPGYTMGVYGVELEPGEKDELHFSGDWKDISYTTAGTDTPDLEIGIETAGADYEFSVHAGSETGGQKVELSLDAKAGTFAVLASAKDGEGDYEVEVRKIDKGGEQVFEHKGVASHGGDKFVFHYADWKGNGQPMAAGLDKGGDGSVDETDELTDEE